MKRCILAAAVLLVSVAVQASVSIDTILSLPNARVSEALDLKSMSTGPGADASIFMINKGLLAINIGAAVINNITYGDVSLSTSLNQWNFVHIQYLWQTLYDADIAIWIGGNLANKTTAYGVSGSLIKFGGK